MLKAKIVIGAAKRKITQYKWRFESVLQAVLITVCVSTPATVQSQQQLLRFLSASDEQLQHLVQKNLAGDTFQGEIEYLSSGSLHIYRFVSLNTCKNGVCLGVIETQHDGDFLSIELPLAGFLLNPHTINSDLNVLNFVNSEFCTQAILSVDGSHNLRIHKVDPEVSCG